jgi:hypothetical protein
MSLPHLVEVAGTLIGTAVEQAFVTRDHIEGLLNGGKIGFEVAVAVTEALVDQPPDQRGARNSLRPSQLVEQASLILLEVDVRSVYTPDYTP